jgi:hypothetical protein
MSDRLKALIRLKLPYNRPLLKAGRLRNFWEHLIRLFAPLL